MNLFKWLFTDKESRKREGIAMLLGRYAELVKDHGVGSKEALEFLTDNKDHQAFQELAKVVDDLRNALMTNEQVVERMREYERGRNAQLEVPQKGTAWVVLKGQPVPANLRMSRLGNFLGLGDSFLDGDNDYGQFVNIRALVDELHRLEELPANAGAKPSSLALDAVAAVMRSNDSGK